MVVVMILLTMLMMTMMFFYDDLEDDDDDDDFEDDDEGDFEGVRTEYLRNEYLIGIRSVGKYSGHHHHHHHNCHHCSVPLHEMALALFFSVIPIDWSLQHTLNTQI